MDSTQISRFSLLHYFSFRHGFDGTGSVTELALLFLALAKRIQILSTLETEVLITHVCIFIGPGFYYSVTPTRFQYSG